jgi:uncharacterized protein
LIAPAWFLANLIVLFGAFVTGITGFGFVLIAAALLLLILDVKSVVILNVILGTIVCLPVAWQARKYLRSQIILILAVSSILGLPLGIWILSHVSLLSLKLIVISGVIIFAILLASGISIKFKRERLACAASGFISGTLSNSAGLGGPPVILFLLNQGWEKDVFRGNISAYFALNGIAAAISLAVTNNLPPEKMVYALSMVPALIIGLAVGMWVLPRINAVLFRKIAVFLLLGCGLVGIVEAVMTLW